MTSFGLPAPNEFDGAKTTTVQGVVGAYQVGPYTIVDPDDVNQVAFTTTGQAVFVQNVQNAGAVSVQVSGTWTGSLAFLASVDGSNYTAWTLYSAATSVTSVSSNGIWVGPAQGIFSFQVFATSLTSGTASVSVRVSAAPFTLSATGATSDTGATAANSYFAWNGRSQLAVREATLEGQMDVVILLLQDMAFRLALIAADSASGRGAATLASDVFRERFASDAR